MNFLPNFVFYLVRHVQSVHHEETVRQGTRQDEVPFAHLGVKANVLLFHAVGHVGYAVLDPLKPDLGRQVVPPTHKAAAIAVIANPFAGHYVEDLSELMDIGAELGRLLGEMCVKALGIRPDQAESFGKAAIVGESGEWEHAAAILHPKLGAPLRKALAKGAALVPSVKKLGGPGTAIDIPLGHKDAAYVRSHFDGMEVRLSDAPRSDEILVAIAVTDSGRPFARVGGLTTDAVKGEDGLR